MKIDEKLYMIDILDTAGLIQNMFDVRTRRIFSNERLLGSFEI